MRDLEIDVVKIATLPINSRRIKRLIDINTSTYMLNDRQVVSLQKGLPSTKSVVVKDHVSSIEWVPMENMLYMADGYTFECLNVTNKDNVLIVIPDGYLINEWSPIQDRVALINDKKVLQVAQLIPSSACCTFLGYYALETEEPSPFIDIGWGSKKTQFRGSEGQKLAICAANETSEISDESYNISWRADGEYFAVSFVRNAKRIFKVFTADCVFCFESEPKPGLSKQLAWQPDGNIIACEQRTGDQAKICFFEKNGLYRSDIKLSSTMYMSKIQWNQNGDVLLVWQHDSDTTHYISDEITLWTCSNWHWAQKQSLLFHRWDQVNYVAWDNNWLQVITVKNYISYSWRLIVHRSIAQEKDCDELSNQASPVYRSLGAITVIDGAKLRVTITAEALIPPPMCHYEIDFDCQVNDVIFVSENNKIAVILNDYTAHIVELHEETYNKINQFKICQEFKIPFSLHHFLYRPDESCLYCIESLIHESSFVNRYLLADVVTDSKAYLSTPLLTDLIRVNQPRYNDFHLALCQGAAISVYHVTIDTNEIIETMILIATGKGPGDRGGQTSVHYLEDAYHSFSLFDNNFYLDGEICATSISSYLICHGCVLLTTETMLYCVKLNEKGLKQLQKRDLASVYSRTIPDGALLVIAVPDKREIVLQVPRGDLETVCPRMLALHDIDKLLTEQKYMDAYTIARTDHINLNVFYDLDPNRFLENIDSFITDVRSCEYLDNFLSQLTERNITDELYGDCNLEKKTVYQNLGSKVELIVYRMITAMKRTDVNFYLRPIITAYITLGNDDALDKASMELLDGKERSIEKPMHISPDDILDHMILLTSVEKMFDVALGLNKVYMIMWVASKSQKNPSEYIPFLLDLVKMKPDYQLYKINRHIRRFEAAFTFLIKCDDVEDEIENFVREYRLYPIVIKYIKPEHKWYKTMMSLYRDYLNEIKQYREAGYLSLKISDYHSALDSFLSALQVEEYLYTLTQMKLDFVCNTHALENLKNKLLSNKKYKEASNILEHNLKNYEDAIQVLIDGKLWSDAEFLSKKYDRYDMMEVDIKPALINYADELEKTIKSAHEEFTTLKKRLDVIRSKKLDSIQRGQDREIIDEVDPGDVQVDTKDLDLQSIVSTHQSQASTRRSDSSRTTTASSRQKKRMERKKILVREGNEFEGIAIIRRLHILITDMHTLNTTVSETCNALLVFHQQFQKTVEVQSAYATLVDLMHTSTDVIWPKEMVTPSMPLTNEALVFRDQIEHLEFVYRYPPPDLRNKWNKLAL